MSNTTTIAVVGYGEVGRIFAKAFLAHAHVKVQAFDILFGDSPDGRRRIADAGADGVLACHNAAEAATGADIVVSAVTADRTLEVAEEAAGYMRVGQIFFDINSASPVTKRTAAEKIGQTGALYVEGAVMAPVPPVGVRVPILAGGPAAEQAAGILNALGMNVTAVTTEPGRASAMKLCRSIMIKGLEALIIDCAQSAKAWGIEKEVYESLSGTFPSIDWPKLAVTMAGRVSQHGIRRAAEMREAAEMLADLGRDPGLCRAIADSHERHARAETARRKGAA
ncbi:MAG: NAD(P)-dependent oxidoreductase [Proteobacteria bacterium]|nr:NAD(P)-dependent oxidoreductase [Pseudomonadota bacterium]